LVYAHFGAGGDIMTEKHLTAQIKKMAKVLERTQKENAEKKAPLREKLDEMELWGETETKKYKKLRAEADSIRTISDGTKKTYHDTASAVLREAFHKFGTTHWKDLTPEQTKEILQDRIDKGQKPQTIRKVVAALEYIQDHVNSSRVFKKDNIQITNHQDMLSTLKEQKIIRKSSDSHRYKATPEEALKVIEEMEKYNPFYASIARYEYLTGFRVSEAIRQKGEHVHDDRHHSVKAKGGLDNWVMTNHHTTSEKAFMNDLKANAEEHTGRIFPRQSDGSGGFKSDEQIRLAVTQMAHRCAERLGIHGPNGETFSSHSFRGAFAMNRMEYYAVS